MPRMPFFALASLLLLAGCGGNLERLIAINPQDKDFNATLASEYLAYSQSEAELGHPIHADYFAAKGLKATAGETVEPEPVPQGLPELVAEQLNAARSQLMALLTDDIKRLAPREAARTMLVFDCWAHQQEKHNAEEGVPCSKEFESAISELEDAAESFAHTREIEKTLTFYGKEVILSPEMLQIIDSVARDVAQLLKYRVEITAMPYNRSTSYHDIAEVRANAVRVALIERGVPSQYIDIHDTTTSKTVFLSFAEEEEPRNTVTISVKILSDSKQGGGQ